MGVHARDIFGGAGAPQPAAPGTYGVPPTAFRLPDATTLGLVRLQVADLGRSLAFYEGVLGLRAIEQTEAQATLAAHGDDRGLIELQARPGARPAPRRGVLGLYHVAILLPDKPALGRFVRHLGDIGAQAGAADHLVSEAFYLQDPDNLGIEVYYDRPRESWKRVERELMMATDPVDVAGLLRAAGDTPWSGMPAGTAIGHVHLHVGNIAGAASFYSEGIGFDRTVWHYPGALFLGSGGYHHNLGTNTWAGHDAVPAAEQDARLLEWTIEVPDAETVTAIGESLARVGHAAEWQAAADAAAPRELIARDPWNTQVRVRAKR